MIKKVCDVCGKETEEYIITADGDIVCDDCCRTDKIKRCSCGTYILASKKRCNDCEEKLYKVDINPYSTKPVPMFKNHYTNLRTNIKNQRYYGFEMEFNHVNACKIHTLGLDLYKEKLIYNKSDSSIYDGVEVVTSPLDRKSVANLFDRLEPMFEYVRRNINYMDSAGLHIHVSKDSIPVPDRYKLCLLLNNSDVSLREKDMMYYLSGRIKELGRAYDDHYYRIGTVSGWRCRAESHGVALNTANSTTYEFRIFKSSADKKVLMSYVELTDKMIDFCHTHGLKDITIGKFINWLKVNTRDRIILDKIKDFEIKSGSLPNVARIVTPDKIMELFKGIHWTDYGKLVSALQHQRNIKRAIVDYQTYSESTKVKGDRNVEVQERLLNTYRKTAMNYILKNQNREELKCA